MEKTTNTLTSILNNTDPNQVNQFFETYSDDLIHDEKPFAAYMKALIRSKNLQQLQIFLDSDISPRYGYKILSEEKRTKQRDTIIRLCLSAQFTLEEAQRALKIYGMSPLYPRRSRDALLIVAFNKNIRSMEAVNHFLTSHNEIPLNSSSATDD